MLTSEERTNIGGLLVEIHSSQTEEDLERAIDNALAFFETLKKNTQQRRSISFWAKAQPKNIKEEFRVEKRY